MLHLWASLCLQDSLDASELAASRQHDNTQGISSSTSIVAQFHADKKARQAHELDLRQKELACMQLVREQRRESIKTSTRALYDRYQAVFSKWCTEAGYSDANVIEEKVLRYWTCLTASKEDPSKGIIILPTGMRGKRKSN
ncbi:hypothetical protein EMPS_11210 [Entomortierella parvispora]|uniref:Uncharacterized protein n=1 Tax=Entomortierella parvispora TaxID=205924 RepID=A0A9P3M1R1_9FUNG|nr:hypothetical protein EMPS_11210 [Entomortierella parvispora]